MRSLPPRITVAWSKGDRLGYWVVLKKGFTPKMKWSNACECVDSAHCRPVPPEVLADIREAYDGEPAKAKKFQAATSEPRPYIQNCWISLPEGQMGALEEGLASLPARFTKAELGAVLDSIPELKVGVPPSPVLLNLQFQPYDLDEDFDPIYCGYSLD